MSACIECQHMTLRDHPSTADEKSAKAAKEMAGHGMSRCKRGPGWEFLNPHINRDCKRFSQAEATTVTKRAEWLARHR